MAGTVYSNFFWHDYAGDPKLKLCCAGAQALWMRMLCLAAESETPGHVLIGSKIPTDADYSDNFGSRAFPIDKVKEWREELIAKEVCNVGRGGVLINRRMVREAQKRHRNSSGGKKASAVTSRNEKGIYTGRNGVHRVQSPVPESSTITSTDSGTGTEAAPGTLEKALSKAEQLCNAIGESLTADVRKANWPMLINRMTDSGVDFDCVLNIARRMKAEGQLPEDGVRTPMFFEARARDLMRKGGPRPSEVVATAPSKSQDEWWHALAALLMVGAWVKPEFGPSPFEPGCKAPPALLAKAREQWEKQGNLPSSVLVGNAYLAWSPRYKQHSLIPEPRPFYVARAA